MCYNYSLNTSIKSLESRFKASTKTEIELPVYHAFGFSYGKMPVVTNLSPDSIDLFQWGLIPAWIKSDTSAADIKKFNLNAKSETIFEKISFKSSIISKRCLIPATGYFEWQHVNKEKIPYYIFLQNRDIFSFAGIWDTFTTSDHREINTFAILTTTADEFNSKIHNTKKRMPVILEEEQEKQWLEPNLEKKNIEKMFKNNNLKFDAYKVSRLLSDKNVNTNIEKVLNRIDKQYNNLTLF